MQELEKRALEEPSDPYVWAVIVAIATSVVLYFGRYGFIQMFSTIMVVGFTGITMFTVLLLQSKEFWAISGSEFVDGLRFQIPPAGALPTVSPVATALAAFGIIGVGASELIMYPYWCLEKGYAKFTGPREDSSEWAQRARGWMRVMHIDVWASMVVYTFATVAFYLLGAAVLGRVGLNPAGGEMVRTLSEMYVPVFGTWAPSVFLLGAVAVLYSTFFVAAAGQSRMVADGLGLFGWHDGSDATRARWTRVVSVLWPLVAVVLYCWIRAPARMVLASGVAQAIMLPMLGWSALYFRYRRCDARLRPSMLWDLSLWISVAGLAIAGTWSAISNLPAFLGGG
jgi:Mn2+/Fe2+ NRAMP family transporter